MTVVECYGIRCSIQGLESEELIEVCHLTGFSCGDSSEPNSGSQASFSKRGTDYRLGVDGAFLGESSSLEVLIEILKVYLIKRVASANPKLLFLRGDVLQTASGEVVVIAGPSISGKSRLAQAFVAQGAAICSQDVAVLDSSGRLLAFPSRNLPDFALSPTVLLMLDYKSDVELELEDLSAGQAVLRLTGTQILPSDDLSEVFARLGQLSAQCKTRLAGCRGDCLTVVTKLASWFKL